MPKISKYDDSMSMLGAADVRFVPSRQTHITVVFSYFHIRFSFYSACLHFLFLIPFCSCQKIVSWHKKLSCFPFSLFKRPVRPAICCFIHRMSCMSATLTYLTLYFLSSSPRKKLCDIKVTMVGNSINLSLYWTLQEGIFFWF